MTPSGFFLDPIRIAAEPNVSVTTATRRKGRKEISQSREKDLKTDFDTM